MSDDTASPKPKQPAESQRGPTGLGNQPWEKQLGKDEARWKKQVQAAGKAGARLGKQMNYYREDDKK